MVDVDHENLSLVDHTEVFKWSSSTRLRFSGGRSRRSLTVDLRQTFSSRSNVTKSKFSALLLTGSRAGNYKVTLPKDCLITQTKVSDMNTLVTNLCESRSLIAIVQNVIEHRASASISDGISDNYNCPCM